MIRLAVLTLLMVCCVGALRAEPPTVRDFGRPIEVARFQISYPFEVFPVDLLFAHGKVHLLYMTGRRSEPQLIYRTSGDAGLTWSEPVELAAASMARTWRDDDTLWVLAVTGDTLGFSRYGDTLTLLSIDLKTAGVSGRQALTGPGDERESRPLGMPAFASRGDRMVAAVVADRSPGLPDLPANSGSLLVFDSIDRGKTWSRTHLTGLDLADHSSVAPCPYVRADGSATLLFARRGLCSVDLPVGKPAGVPVEVSMPTLVESSVYPAYAARSGDLLHLAMVEPLARARFLLSSSADAKSWSRPKVLATDVPFILSTPFANLAAVGKRMVFGFTSVRGVGEDPAAHLRISSDDGESFTALDLGSLFRGGSLLPAPAIEPDSGKVAWVTVTLLPRQEGVVGLNVVESASSYDAWLVFASSPVVKVDAGMTDEAMGVRIEALIRQLGDAQYEQRESASKSLTEMGELAVPFLKRALDDPDAEIATRVRLILRTVTPVWYNPPGDPVAR